MSIPLRLDPSIDDEVAQLAAARACDIVNINLQHVGGCPAALRMMQACAARNIPVCMGTGVGN